MPGTSLLKWVAVLALTTGGGCCKWCERHCCQPQNNCCQPCYCQPSTCCSTPSGPTTMQCTCTPTNGVAGQSWKLVPQAN